MMSLGMTYEYAVNGGKSQLSYIIAMMKVTGMLVVFDVR